MRCSVQPLTYIFRIRQIKILCKLKCNFHFRLTLFYRCYSVVVVGRSCVRCLGTFYNVLLACQRLGSSFQPLLSILSRTMHNGIAIQSISVHSFYARESIDQICQLSHSSIQFHCIFIYILVAVHGPLSSSSLSEAPKEKKEQSDQKTRKLEIVTKNPSKHCQITCNFSSFLRFCFADLFFLHVIRLVMRASNGMRQHCCFSTIQKKTHRHRQQQPVPTVMFFNYLKRRKKTTTLSLHLTSHLKRPCLLTK